MTALQNAAMLLAAIVVVGLFADVVRDVWEQR